MYIYIGKSCVDNKKISVCMKIIKPVSFVYMTLFHTNIFAIKALQV